MERVCNHVLLKLSSTNFIQHLGTVEIQLQEQSLILFVGLG